MTTPDQLTRDDLAAMTPEQIDAAHRAGRFAELLGGSSDITLDDLSHLSTHDFLAAHSAGRLDHLTNPQTGDHA